MSERFQHLALVFRALLLFLRIDWGFRRRGFNPVFSRISKAVPARDVHGAVDPRIYFQAVSHATRYYIRWRRDCLPKALTTYYLLRRAGAIPELCIGVRQFPFEAHAWVECGGFVLDEHPHRVETYTVLRRHFSCVENPGASVANQAKSDFLPSPR